MSLFEDENIVHHPQEVFPGSIAEPAVCGERQ
jgi:hypothetical protein